MAQPQPQEDMVVDSQLGYPLAYAKLCAEQMQGSVAPFYQAPPQRFRPYSPPQHQVARMREMDALFPTIVPETEYECREAAAAPETTTTTTTVAEELWRRMEHLGSAGIDPALFRVDVYGNVLYRDADPSSPLAWAIDHWFPVSRGGLSVLSNLRIVQWQVQQKKAEKLEFLVPWWDLQLGVSVNRFLSVLLSPDSGFKKRSTSLFFPKGIDCMPSISSSAPAAFPNHGILKLLDGNSSSVGHTGRKRWRIEGSQHASAALRHALMTTTELHGGSRCKKRADQVTVLNETGGLRGCRSGEEDGDDEGGAAWRRSSVTVVQIVKTKMKEDVKEKENKTKDVKAMARQSWRRGGGGREAMAEVEDGLRRIRAENEKEGWMVREMERSLAKQTRRVEKQKAWYKAQSQYRRRLEQMIQQTMEQCTSFGEQAREQQNACLALLDPQQKMNAMAIASAAYSAAQEGDELPRHVSVDPPGLNHIDGVKEGSQEGFRVCDRAIRGDTDFGADGGDEGELLGMLQGKVKAAMADAMQEDEDVDGEEEGKELDLWLESLSLHDHHPSSEAVCHRHSCRSLAAAASQAASLPITSSQKLLLDKSSSMAEEESLKQRHEADKEKTDDRKQRHSRDPMLPSLVCKNENVVENKMTLMSTPKHEQLQPQSTTCSSSASVTSSSAKSGGGPRSPSLCRRAGECRRATPPQKQRPAAAIATDRRKEGFVVEGGEGKQAAGLARQRSVGGAAARKVDMMLMKSASVRGGGGGGGGGAGVVPDASILGGVATSSGGAEAAAPFPARRCHSINHGRAASVASAAAPRQPSQQRRKTPLFHDWDYSLSHVWKKAVKKLDLSRQHRHQ